MGGGRVAGVKTCVLQLLGTDTHAPAAVQRARECQFPIAVLDSILQPRNARLPERGTSGSVQRGPANPARPGREQRYRECLGCRGSPEVPRFFPCSAVGGQCSVKAFEIFDRTFSELRREISS